MSLSLVAGLNVIMQQGVSLLHLSAVAVIAQLLPHNMALMGLLCEPQLLKQFLPDEFTQES